MFGVGECLFWRSELYRERIREKVREQREDDHRTCVTSDVLRSMSFLSSPLALAVLATFISAIICSMARSVLRNFCFRTDISSNGSVSRK